MSCFSAYFGVLKPCYAEAELTIDNRPKCRKGESVCVERYFSEWKVPCREFGGKFHQVASWNDVVYISKILGKPITMPWGLWDIVIFRCDWQQAADMLCTMEIRFSLDGEYVRFEDHPLFQDRSAQYAYVLLDMG